VTSHILAFGHLSAERISLVFGVVRLRWRYRFVWARALPLASLHGKEPPLSLGTILLIIVVIALLGGFSGIGGGRFYGTGYYGGGGLGLILVILLILVLMGRL
jgi:hypothetical protein